MASLDYYKHCEDLVLPNTLGVNEDTTKAYLINGAATEGTVSYITRMQAENDHRTVRNLFNYSMKLCLKIIERLQSACQKDGDDNFWLHKKASDVAQMMKNGGSLPDREEIDIVVSEYLGYKVRFQAFDRVAIDMLMGSELFSIMSHLKAQSGMAGFLFGNARLKRELEKCWKIASAAYCEMDSQGAISLAHIRNVTADAQKQGIVWPGSLFALLDDALTRGTVLRLGGYGEPILPDICLRLSK